MNRKKLQKWMIQIKKSGGWVDWGNLYMSEPEGPCYRLTFEEACKELLHFARDGKKLRIRSKTSGNIEK